MTSRKPVRTLLKSCQESIRFGFCLQKYEFYKEAKDWVQSSIIWKCTHLLTYSIFICVKWLRSSASSTLGSLGASVIFLRGIPKVWKRRAMEDIAGLTGMGWDEVDLWELFSFRNKQTHPELEPQLAVIKHPDQARDGWDINSQESMAWETQPPRKRGRTLCRPWGDEEDGSGGHPGNAPAPRQDRWNPERREGTWDRQ